MSETLKTIVAEETGLPPATISISLRPPLDYQSNRLYNMWVGNRHLIAKEFLKPAEFEDAPIHEYRALQLLAPLDIAPQPVLYRPPTPSLGPVVVYEFMEGAMWDRRHPTPSELAQLAEVWLKISAVSIQGLWMSRGHDRSFDENEARFRAQFQAYAAWVEAEFPQRTAAQRETSALHGPCPGLAGDGFQRPDGRLGRCGVLPQRMIMKNNRPSCTRAGP